MPDCSQASLARRPALPRATRPERPGLLRLDGETYRHAARLPEQAAHASGRAERWWFAVTHLDLVPDYVRLLRSLSTVPLAPGSTPAGRRLAALFAGESWRRSAAHAVLELPTVPDDYLRGRARQAVRTELRKAAADGLVAGPLHADVAGVLARYARERAPDQDLAVWHAEVGQAGARWWCVRDAAGDVVGVACALVDGPQAVLRLVSATDDRAVSASARVALHTALATDLAGDGVRLLVLRDALHAVPGLQYHAARLGYVPRRVRVG